MKVGDLDVIQILDGEWITPAAPGIPQMTAEELAQHGEYLLPDGRMKAALGAFLVRTGNQVVLIDAGLGPAPGACDTGSCGHAAHQDKAPAQSSTEFEEFFRKKGASETQIRWFTNMLAEQSLEHGWLAGNLERAGVRPEEITDVVLSHLHPDHMGWVARDGAPFFPKAKLWAHQADVDLFLGENNPDETTFKVMLGVDSTKERMKPVHSQIQTWDRDCTIAPGIDLRHLPGHTPGSSITVISSQEERAMILGDVIHCPLELVDDDFAIMADIDPQMAKESKAVVRREIEGTTVHVSSTHFPGLEFGRLLSGKGKRYWSWAT
jgi:glyoxylase-like metal-dependent hydrolase (beta-lactamase superfamily II)